MQEVGYDNIRVSYVMPGSVATGFSRRRRIRAAPTGRSPATMSPRSWSTCSSTIREVFRAASSSGLRSPRNNPYMSVFDKHRDSARTPRDDDGQRARAAGRGARSADGFARARRPARRVLPERAVSRASPQMDIALVLEQLDDAKQLVQSAMEELRVRA